MAEGTGRLLPQAGRIVDEGGRQLGLHQGLANYTIGQRKGLGLSAREPLHVLRLDSGRNAVVVGPAPALERTDFTVRQTTFTAGEAPTQPLQALVKGRYKAPTQPAPLAPPAGRRAPIPPTQPPRAH